VTALRPARLLLFALLSAVPLLAADPKPAKYPFAKPPLELLDELAKADLGEAPVPSDPERKLLAKVWQAKAKKPDADPKLKADEWVELALFASGVEEADARKKWAGKLADLRRKVRDELKGVTGTAARGEVLMRVVYADALKAKDGYVLRQSSVAVALDTGKYNCVSSSAVVYLVGVANGFDLRPMAIDGTPGRDGHAYLELVEGKERLVVECTNPLGFDCVGKEKRKEIKPVGPQPDRAKAHETDAAGLVAMLYSNRGADFDRLKTPDRPAAARCQLSAIALDPAGAMAVNNLTSALTNWGVALGKGKRHDRAVRFHTLALAAAPDSAALKRNAAVSVDEWAKEAMDDHDWNKALRIYADGLKQLPGDGLLTHNQKYCEQMKAQAQEAANKK
jgi:hypothetical protein